MQTIGSTFKNIREERRLVLENVTKETGINKTLLSRIENGKRLPTREQVIQLGKYYNAENYVYIKTAESEGTVFHPTQKPIELGPYLIKTFTNPGDIVLDNTCRSGSFLLFQYGKEKRNRKTYHHRFD